MSVEWARAEALLLLVPLAALLWLSWRGRGPALPLPRAAAMRPRGAPRLVARLPLLARAAVLALLVVAVAGPRTAGALVEEETRGIPVVVALDVSSSMLVRDLGSEDRLTTAKAATARFIAERERDPIALVAFAGEALTLVPLTMHRRLLAGALDGLAVGLLEDGTAIGDGLAIALARLRDVEAESRVVVLMSDGSSNRGEVDPLEAAAAAAALGVRVYTIGIGSEAVSPAGSEVGPAEGAAALDDALLRQIAEATGGEYFRAADAGALDRVYGEIDRLVASPLERSRRLEHREWHLHLLAVAAALLLLEWALRGSRWGALP